MAGKPGRRHEFQGSGPEPQVVHHAPDEPGTFPEPVQGIHGLPVHQPEIAAPRGDAHFAHGVDEPVI